MKKTVWITGATGFIGRALVTDWKKNRPEWDLHFIDREAKIPKTAPDLVVHLATHFQNAYQPDEAKTMIGANLQFPVKVLEACREFPKLRFLNFGTFYSHIRPNEDSPATFYAATKRAFESFLEFYFSRPNWKAITLKLFDSYGPGDKRPKLVPKWIEILRTGEEMKLTPGEQKLNLLYVDDIVEAIGTASDSLLRDEKGHGHTIYQLSSSERAESLPSLREVAKIFEGAAGKPLPLRFGALPYRENEIMVPKMSFPILPGWSPKTSLHEGFKKVLGT